MSGDAYEREYMDRGDIVYREKHVARIFVGIFAAMALAIAALGVFITITALLHGAGIAALAGLAPLVTAGLLTFVALYFAVMRTTVSRTHLAVSWGTLGKTVPLDAITSTRFEERIGLGPKFDGHGWNYGPMGTSRGVRVEWAEGSKTHTCYVGASDPEALMRAIEEGRSAARTRVSVDSSSAAREGLESGATVEAPGAAEARRS